MTTSTTHETTSIRRLRTDRLTEVERIEALFAREQPDRVPLWPINLGFSARNVGLDLKEFYMSPAKSVRSALWTCSQYGWTPFTLYFGSVATLAVEFGGEVKYPESEYAQGPMVVRNGVERPEQIDELRVPPDLAKCGDIPRSLEATASALQYDGWALAPLVLGPMDSAYGVLGLQNALKWMFKEPELLHRAFRVFTDTRIAMAKLWADIFGTDRLIPVVGGPSQSNQIISPKQFEEFCLPYIKEQNAAVREMGFKHMILHPCGDQNLNMPLWAECELGDPGIISVGHEIDLDTVARYFPDHIAMGNLEPAKIQTETPQQVYEESRDLINKGKRLPGGYIFSAGCELPPNANPYNVWAMTKAVNDFGWYE